MAATWPVSHQSLFFRHNFPNFRNPENKYSASGIGRIWRKTFFKGTLTGGCNVCIILNLNNFNMVYLFCFLVILIAAFALAKWYYTRQITLFRSGDLIQERKLFGGFRSGTLSKFDNDKLAYIPDNGYDLVQRNWYWFYLINNISFNERAK
jgi:hypothetical protein